MPQVKFFKIAVFHLNYPVFPTSPLVADSNFAKNGDDGSLYCPLESVPCRATRLRCEEGLGKYIQVYVVDRLEAVELQMVLEAIC